MTRIIAAMLMGLSAAPAAAVDKPGAVRNDYDAVAKAAAWNFAEKDADVAAACRAFPKPYSAGALPAGDALLIEIRKDNKRVFAFKGHSRTVLVGDGDTLYYADYGPHSTGCSLVAVDLTTGKTLWKAVLQGVGPVDHTEYTNLVNLSIENAEVLRVYGNEAYGRYVELVDRKTGKTVGHKRFPKEKP